MSRHVISLDSFIKELSSTNPSMARKIEIYSRGIDSLINELIKKIHSDVTYIAERDSFSGRWVWAFLRIVDGFFRKNVIKTAKDGLVPIFRVIIRGLAPGSPQFEAEYQVFKRTHFLSKVIDGKKKHRFAYLDDVLRNIFSKRMSYFKELLEFEPSSYEGLDHISFLREFSEKKRGIGELFEQVLSEVDTMVELVNENKSLVKRGFGIIRKKSISKATMVLYELLQGFTEEIKKKIGGGAN